MTSRQRLSHSFLAAFLISAALSCSTGAERSREPATLATTTPEPLATPWSLATSSRDPELVERWITEHPGSPDLPEARTLLDDLRWTEARENGSLAACDQYLTKFPEGHHREAARALRDDLSWLAVKAEDVEAVRAWRKANPQSVHAREAEELWEDLRYAQIEAGASLKSCDLYLREFPSGRYAQKVRQTRSALEWRATSSTRDPQAIRRWIEQNPDSEWGAEARVEWERLRFVEVQERRTKEICDLYLREFPHGPNTERVRAIREDANWRAVESSGSAEALRQWIAQNPGGAQIPAARRALEDLSFQEVKRAGSSQACDLHLKEFPHGRYTAEVRAIQREARAWERVVRQDTVAEYLRFKEQFSRSAHRSLAEQKTSRRYWSQVVAHEPKNAHALIQLAESCLLEAACSMAQVQGYYRQALVLNPKNPRALLGLARMSYDTGDDATAHHLLHRSLAMDPRIAEAHFYLGKLEARRKACAIAIQHFDRALQLAPDHLEALFHRGSCRVLNGSCRQALPDFQKVVALAPNGDSKFVRQAQDHIRSCR